MALTTEQITEMSDQLRKESEAGRPEVAARYRAALQQGEYYETPSVKPKVVLSIPPTNGPGSSKEKWAEFAASESDLDPEIIEAATKNDLITMLRANGIIPMPEPNEE